MATMEQNYPVAEEGTPLKLFVGQVPKDMDEEQLRPLFEQAGPIAHIMVIRDRQTDAHRGCAFLTYQTREAGERAVEKFHNKVKLPNAHNPVQVRPADSQMGDERHGTNGRTAPVDRENKLFVGMLPHDADDMTLTEVFSRFGEITEIYCMRNPDGTPKGCAFVKFSTRSAAIAAIEALHEKCTMDGATRALVVKFADVKKTQSVKSWMLPEGRAALGLHGASVRPGSVGGYWQATAPSGRDVFGKGRQMYPDFNRGYPYQVSGPGYPSAHMGPGGGYSQYGPEYHPHPPQAQGPRGHGGHHGGYVFSHTPPYNLHYPGRPAEHSLSPSSVTGGDRSQTFGSQPGAAGPGAGGMRGESKDGREHPGGSRPQEGPPGANLFIYHLPNDLTDADLATAFAPFGHVISAKVFLDKRTGESKGFGFVSYNHPSEAEVAIGKMNGFQIGSKRLKVQHKKSDHGDRDTEGAMRFSGHGHSHHGGARDMQQPMQTNMAPLHGGSRLGGMGYGGGAPPPDASPEMRAYHSESSKVMYTGGGDTRTIYAGQVPSSSSYDGGAGAGGDDPAAAGAGYRVNVTPNPMGHGSTAGSSGGGGSGGGGSGGGAEGGDVNTGAQQQGGGGIYHADGGGDEGGL
ncbi:unnamed protein product [Pylaiella littoralis]